ncbi:MAG: endonuclease III domain-containing protein [Nitrospinae bacterium]|nr:endonuclease III domain-containing protein [Nitrospinota bacterium]
MNKQLMAVYRALHRHYGPQGWWPAKTNFEVCVGAMLTQNTAWENVARAIANIHAEKALTLRRLRALPRKKLETLIKPSGYFRLKAKRLMCLLDYLAEDGGGWRARMRKVTLEEAREALLAVHGVGPETADSILLYAAQRPSFVVDKYTLRWGGRYGIFKNGTKYEEARNFFMEHLPENEKLYNEYHALIVRLGATVCKAKPLCAECPLAARCAKRGL